jgi:flagellar assembly protein FliH
MSSSAASREISKAAEIAAFRYPEAAFGEGASQNESDTDEGKQRLHMEALAEARRQGQQEGRAEMSAAVQKEREQIAQALREFASERTDYYRRIEGEVVQLALAVARKILHREAQLDPQALAGIVRVTIESMDAGTKVSLHVAPRDVTEWRHFFARQMEGERALEVREDPTLAAGECRIETALGTTEVGFESQLKEIETGLLDLLAERPGSS